MVSCEVVESTNAFSMQMQIKLKCSSCEFCSTVSTHRPCSLNVNPTRYSETRPPLILCDASWTDSTASAEKPNTSVFLTSHEQYFRVRNIRILPSDAGHSTARPAPNANEIQKKKANPTYTIGGRPSSPAGCAGLASTSSGGPDRRGPRRHSRTG